VLRRPVGPTAQDEEATRVASFGAAVALLTLVRIGSVGAGFLASVLAARLIGADGLGLAGSAFTLATAGALLSSGGLNIAGIYYLGRRPEEQRAVVARIVTLGAGAAVLAAVVSAVGCLLLADAVLAGASASLIGAVAALGAVILVFELLGGLLLGLHQRGAFIVVQGVEAIGSLALTALVLVAVDRSATGYLAAAALGYAVAGIVAAGAIRARIGPIRPSYAPRFAREALAMGVRGQVGNVLQYLSLRLDLLLVAGLLDLRAAGIYFVAVRVSEVVSHVANSASAFLFPQVAAQAEARDTRATEQATRLTLLTVLIGGGVLALLVEPLLSLAFGAEFVSGAGAVRLTLLAMIPLTVTRLLSGDLKGRGRAGIVSWGALVGLVATVGLDLLLIPAFGIVGAALASILSYALAAGFLVIAYRRITGSSASGLAPRPSDLGVLARLVVRRRAGGSA
jgi:O-antigen/teichoic acid export membrane protein